MANTLETNFYGDNTNLGQPREVFTMEEIRNLERQLREPEIIRDEDLELFYFILTLTNGKKTKKTIYPDIIIHKRGTLNNYIVIEAKKNNNSNREARLFDIVKLLTLVRSEDFDYKQGVFINLPVESDFKKLKRFKIKQNFFDKKVYEINPISK